jgi:glucosyl-dolichyl phosphate glucuronosyltransferase
MMELPSEENMLLVSIIIPTYNSVDQLRRALQSLIKSNFDHDKFEVIVVDNRSSDNTEAVVNEFIEQNASYNIRYFFENVPGLLSGRHRGAKESLSDILVFIDQDIYADSEWLLSIVNTFSCYPEIQIVGGKCLPNYEKEPPIWLNYFWNSLSEGGKLLGELSLCDFGDLEKEIDPTLVWGLNYSIRKKTLYDLGGFNPDATPTFQQIFQGDGETGLSLKAIEKGYKALYQPKALVYHDVPSSRMTLDYFDKRFFYQGISKSFTDIRRNGCTGKRITKSQIMTDLKNILRPLYRLIIPAENNFENEMLQTRFKAMEKAGYDFHQKMAKKHSLVMKWVMKENYWDYRIPEFEQKRIEL